jgi:hypothetical protein
LLTQIRDRAAAIGAPLVVAGGAEWRALEPDAWLEEISRGNPNSNRLRSGRLQITAPTNQLGILLDRIGVSYINLLPPFEAAFAQNPHLYYEFDKHWTAAGHAVAAAAIDRALRDMELTVPAEATRGGASATKP